MVNEKCYHGIRKTRCKDCGGSDYCFHNKLKYLCKECNPKAFCPHDRRKVQCKDCNGSSYCRHEKRKSDCVECGGTERCRHGNRKSRCKECGERSEYCKHDKPKYQCVDCDGASICPHKILRYYCVPCKGKGICPHEKRRNECKECGGNQICPHGIHRSSCIPCDGSSICPHKKRRYQCVECDGASICPHKVLRRRCFDCMGADCCKGHPDTMCYTRGSKHYRGYCVRCFQHFFPDEEVSKNFRLREKAWADFIREKFPQRKWIFDKIIAGGSSRYRPDAIIDMGTYVIILEFDENQHKSDSYACTNKRTMAIMQDIGFRNLVVIRFNPDCYVNEKGHNITSCWGLDKNGCSRIKQNKKKEYQERLDKLEETIQFHLENGPEKEVTEVKLFYDQVKQEC